MLLNLSNHPSATWPPNQMETARQKYGKVEDLPFPNIDPKLTSDEVEQLAEEYEIIVRKMDPAAVHIMGELTFTYLMVDRLRAIGISCIASTTGRKAITDEKGNKVSTFEFVRFRTY